MYVILLLDAAEWDLREKDILSLVLFVWNSPKKTEYHSCLHLICLKFF